MTAKIIMLHPDLGIGGAERLIIDVALALKDRGHFVLFVTAHHDPEHCFIETVNDLDVLVVGDWIPRHVFNKFHALLAYIRMIYCAFYIVFFSGLNPDIVVCDLISVAIPVLKFGRTKIIYYCHHPDQLLSAPGGILKKMYRKPLNWLEEKTTGMADVIFVNSKYTAQVFDDTFKTLSIKPKILYPSVNTITFEVTKTGEINEILPNPISKDSIIFLSINRYERKKNLALALEAFTYLESLISASDWKKTHLIMAGGYDSRVEENVSHFAELVKLSTELKIEDKVTFLKSPSDVHKITLLRSSSCLVYTPSNEHFGIVPVEAMYLKVPVIAVNNGGPTESVVDGQTGFLCEAQPSEFAMAMSKFVKNRQLSVEFGEKGKVRVIENFSYVSFCWRLDFVVMDLLELLKKS